MLYDEMRSLNMNAKMFLDPSNLFCSKKITNTTQREVFFLFVYDDFLITKYELRLDISLLLQPEVKVPAKSCVI